MTIIDHARSGVCDDGQIVVRVVHVALLAILQVRGVLPAHMPVAKSTLLPHAGDGVCRGPQIARAEHSTSCGLTYYCIFTPLAVTVYEDARPHHRALSILTIDEVPSGTLVRSSGGKDSAVMLFCMHPSRNASIPLVGFESDDVTTGNACEHLFGVHV